LNAAKGAIALEKSPAAAPEKTAEKTPVMAR
jgi:hypothetical protein